MKKIYNTPELRVSVFNTENVVTGSGDPDAYNALTRSTDDGGYGVSAQNTTIWDELIF